MTNEEKANEIAREMLPYNNAEYHACYSSAMQAMQWKDDQHKQEKQQWIEKTCEWIKDNATYYAHWEWNGNTYEKEVVFDAECCVDAFEESIKAMEEEI